VGQVWGKGGGLAQWLAYISQNNLHLGVGPGGPGEEREKALGLKRVRATDNGQSENRQ